MTKELTIRNHSSDIDAQILSQYKDATAFKAFVTSFLNELDSLENDLFIFKTNLILSVATGKNLDFWGSILNSQARPVSDSSFRSNLYALISAYNSDGTAQDIYRLIENVILASQIRIRELWTPKNLQAPTLDLQFNSANSFPKGVTFTRGSVATFYDGETQFKGDENLLTYSENFSQSWFLAFCSLTTGHTAPNGTSDAFAIVDNATDRNHGVYKNVPDDDKIYTVSCYMKKGTRDIAVLRLADINATGNFSLAWFNLDTGLIGTVTDEITAKMTDAGSGWWRCSITSIDPISVNGAGQILICSAATNGDANGYIGNGSEAIYIWGAQLEQRDFVTQYTPTTDQPITNYAYQLLTCYNDYPRIDHDPITGEVKGLLIEESRENLIPYSEDFSQGYWTKNNCSITANSTLAPNGLLEADKFVENTSNSTHNLAGLSNISVTSGTTYSMSLFVKAGERYAFRARLRTTENVIQIVADLSTGTVQAGLNSTIDSIGNGWFKVTAFGAATITNSNARLDILMREDASIESYTGDGYSGIYIWGVQIEQGSFPTSYIPTNGTSVTRAADKAYMDGTAFSSWFNPYESSMYGDYSLSAFRDDNQFLMAANRQANVFVWHINGAGATQNTATDYNSTGNLQYQSNESETERKVLSSFSISQDLIALSVNNSAVIKDLDISPINYDVYTFERLDIGGHTAQNRWYLNGHIKRLTYWPYKLDDTVMQDITSTSPSSTTLTYFQAAPYTVGLADPSDVTTYTYPDAAKFEVYIENPGTPVNRVYYSQDFDQTDYWRFKGTELDNQKYIAPDGTLTAWKLNETSLNDYHLMNQLILCSEGQRITLSVYVKGGERDQLLLREDRRDQVGVIVRDLNGSAYVENGAGGNPNTEEFGIIDAGNGWYRIWVTGIYIGSTQPAIPHVRLIKQDETNPEIYTGVPGEGLYLWGFQMNFGTLQDYNKTVGPVDYQFLYRAINLAKPAGVGYLPINTSPFTPVFAFESDPDATALGFSVEGGQTGGYYSILQPEI